MNGYGHLTDFYKKYPSLLESEEYAFLKTDSHLGKYVILLGLGGSYAYGTCNESSDIDIRGVALNSRSDLLGLTDFEQYVDDYTDTTIYGFQKMIRLLLNCNPNTMELLGMQPENYLYLHPLGEELIQNSRMFLSQWAVRSFGGYADAQIRRLQNALARDKYPQREKEQHILNSIQNAMYDFHRRYKHFENGSVCLYADTAENSDMEAEIFMDVNLQHYPLRDYRNMWMEMNNIVKDYDKAGKQNRKKDNNHLNKHAMHLIRLFMMGIDIMERGEIHTYREKEHDLLVSIRRGDYQKADGDFCPEFYELVSEYKKRMEYAAEHTILPEEPDLFRVQDYVMSVNERVVKDEL